TLNNIGLIYHYRGEYEKALKLCKEAKKIFEEIQDPIGLLKSCYNIWEILKDDKSYEDLINAHDLVRERASTIPASIETLKLKELDIFLIRRDIAEEHIDLSKVVEHYVTIGDLKKAYGAHLRNKNLVSIELLRFSDFKGFKSLKGNERVVDLVTTKNKFGFFYRNKFYNLKLDLLDIEHFFDETLKRSIENFLKTKFRYVFLQNYLEEIRKSRIKSEEIKVCANLVLNKKEVKIIVTASVRDKEYKKEVINLNLEHLIHKLFFLNLCVESLITDERHIQRYGLFNEFRLQELLRSFKDEKYEKIKEFECENIVKESQKIEEKLYSILEFIGEVFEPIYSIDTPELTVVPSQPLLNFPFHLLIFDKKFLFESFEVRFLPHAEFANSLDRNFSGSYDVIACISDFGLYFTKPEAEYVFKILNQNKKVLLENPRLKDLMKYRGDIRILHLSTHAYVDPSNLFNSYIELGEKIRFPDFMKISPKGFVFLSACETGVQEPHRRESLSLQTAILSSGAKAILVSLWKVFDPAGFVFAKEFYRACKGEPSYEAYRKAIDNTRKVFPNVQHFAPYVWFGV
ncbi:MAG: CHAT domain-containing tetratricopeptide repeat protein, partial [Archaeoglobaceae archaeon]|nr:CHAT domain-containing tetratricopeptide repeat protein [Archaeoglobaceae archaeon]